MSRNKIVNGFLCGCTAVILLLAACGIARSNDETQNASSITTPESAASSGILAETLVADPQSLRDCRQINPSRPTAQAAYLGFLPGQSTAEDVKTRLGEPMQTSRFRQVDSWLYSGFVVDVEQNVVRKITVEEDPQIIVSLKQVITNFGCPDLIYAIDMSPDRPSGSYGLTKLVYYTTGVEFLFLDFPVSLLDMPRDVIFFRPESLQSYLERYRYFEQTLIHSKPVSWSEAVK